jgi:glycosyltransferase involved in cell wall biosynthesis
MKNKRELIFVNAFDALAGSQRVAVSLFRAFLDLKIPFKIYLGFGNVGFISEFGGVDRFSSVNLPVIRKLLYPFWVLFLWPKILYAIFKKKIIWANAVYAIPAILPAVLFSPSRLVIHVHEVDFSVIIKILLFFAARQGVCILCVSNFHRERVFTGAKVLLNSVMSSGWAKRQDVPTILFVGNATALKGFPLFIEVIKLLPAHQFRAVACVPSISAASNDLIERAFLAGIEIRVGISDPAQIYTEASLLLQCTDPNLWTETFSLVVVEAISFAVPVATVGLMVAGEILGDAIAFDVPVRDPTVIAAKIVKFFENESNVYEAQSLSAIQSYKYSFPVFRNKVAEVISSLS